MPVSPPSRARRLLVLAALLVPLVVDPLGADTLGLKRMLLGIVGLAVLAIESGEVLRGRKLAPTTWPERLLLLIAVWAGVSLGWAANPAAGLADVAVLAGMFGLTRGVRACIHGEQGHGSMRRWVAGLVGVGVVAVAIDGVAILVARDQLAATGATKYASWLFVHNNMAAAYAAMLAPLALPFALRSLRRALWCIAAGVLVGSLVLLSSRAGVIAVLVALSGQALLLIRRRWVSQLRLARGGTIAVAVVLVGGCALLPYSATARGLSKDVFYQAVIWFEDMGVAELSNAMFRPQLFARTMEMVEDAPTVGVGQGNFAVAYPRYEPTRATKPHAHNDALQLLAELGFPGLVMFLALLGSIALQLLRSLTSGEVGPRYTATTAFAGAMLVFVLMGLFEVPFVLGATACTLAFVMGLTGALHPSRTAARVGRPLGAVVLVLCLAGIAVLVRRVPASMLLVRGYDALDAGDTEQARTAFEDLAALGTGNYLPYQELAALARADGDVDLALAHVRRARALWPYGVPLMIVEGELLADLEHWDEALVNFREAMRTQPSDKDTLYRLLQTLARAGRRPEAIDLLEYELQSNLLVSPDLVLLLARYWNEHSQEVAGADRVVALVAARHFYAVFLQDGSLERLEGAHREFKHVTHQLQSLPGAPDSWWPVYQRFLDEGGWRRPDIALWTALDTDGTRIYPGWEETAGPPLPREMR